MKLTFTLCKKTPEKKQTAEGFESKHLLFAEGMFALLIGRLYLCV